MAITETELKLIGAHGDADLGLGQGRSVVDAAANPDGFTGDSWMSSSLLRGEDHDGTAVGFK